jgi:dGTPase
MAMEWERLLDANRRRQTTMPGDVRIEFERDYDRSVFSTPVKRLQDKAQVFPLEPHDAIRTRLTHSLEVSAVARGLAIHVCKWLVEKQIVLPGMDRSIEAIASTCGLLHDLGNPPFGHSGEDAIREWFLKKFPRIGELAELLNSDDLARDFFLFEGNAQTLRLVSKLQVLADYKGLNLTYGTLSALCKYTASSKEANPDHRDHAKKKPGYFTSEHDVIKEIRDKTGTGDARNPITFLVEAADDIVYSVADIEDGIKKGILSWPELQQLLESTKGSVKKHVRTVLKKKSDILKAGRTRVPVDLADDVHGAAFRTAAISVLVKGCNEAFREHYEAIMAGEFREDLVKMSEPAPLIGLLKDIGKKRIYCTRPNLKLELMGRHVIRDLMDIFWEGAKILPIEDRPVKTKDFAGKAAALLSENYRKVFIHFAKEEKGLPEMYHRFQLLTDYICGMTDTFAKRLHAELTNGA